MSKLQGEILTLPKMSGSVSTPKSLSGNVGAKTINIGGKGDDGATFIPSVSADGIISWTNDKELPNPEPVNIKGVKGDKGEQGIQGIQGIQGETGPKGDDYVLTEEDKKEIAEMIPSGGVSFTTDETLYLENGVLGVNTATDVEGDNTLPITSAAVFETVGNIEILLKTI